MSQLPYDITSAKSIQEYSRRLIGKSLEETVGKYNLDHLSNKGKLGTMVEEHFFQYSPGPNKDHDPDFTEAGVELKVTGVLPKKKYHPGDSPFKAKERLTLTMINYIGLANETWETSSFLKKCQLMLILFYLYEAELPSTQCTFVLDPVLWEFPVDDLKIMKKDWFIIQNKVFEGKAHELSEGDTFYLAASRKGQGGIKERLKIQPFSAIEAKSRAFALKPSYVNTIIDSTWKESTLIESEFEAELGIEEMTYKKFQGLHHKDINELSQTYGFAIGDKKSKNYLASLSLRILGSKRKWLPEFIKAGVVLKTIRLDNNGNLKESMSFPAFDFVKTANQTWEESVFYNKINQKFLFVVFQYDELGVLRFRNVMFWNMPYKDREEAKIVWQKTVDVINASIPAQFPKTIDSDVAHVRPHGKNALDTAQLPDGSYYTKQGFWLNAKYIKTQIQKYSY